MKVWIHLCPLLTSTQFKVYNIVLLHSPPFLAQRVHTVWAWVKQVKETGHWSARVQLADSTMPSWILQTFRWLPLTWDPSVGTYPLGSLLCTAGDHTNTVQRESGTTTWRGLRYFMVCLEMPLTGGTYCVETTEAKAASKSSTQRPILEKFGHSTSVRSVIFFKECGNCFCLSRDDRFTPVEDGGTGS